MGSSFDLIVITAPEFFPGEAACLENLLTEGLQKLHIRKPRAKEEEVETLLHRLSSRWRPRLVLHGQRALAEKLDIPRIHLPLKEYKEDRRVKLSGELGTGGGSSGGPILSTSLHGWEELKEIGQDLDYAFMSPVFDSISKPGYAADPRLLSRRTGHRPCPLIGLGGVHPDNIRLLMDKGWDGAAVLGYLWSDPPSAARRYEQLRNMIKV